MNEEEQVHDARCTVGRLCDQLLAAVSIDGETLDRNSVPMLHGIYLWRFKKDKRPAYVGVALGKRGLRQRLIGQHLRPSYLKSVFRKAVVKEARVAPEEESVKYIRSNFTVTFVGCPNRHPATIAAIAAAEAMVIAALQPKFNKVRGAERGDADTGDGPRYESPANHLPREVRKVHIMNKGHMAYFEKDDVLHFAISDEPEAGSVEVSPNITAELNAKGELIGIEILNASGFVRDSVLESAQAKILKLTEAKTS